MVNLFERDGFKSLVSRVEALIEICICAVGYIVFWVYFYRGVGGNYFDYRGRYVQVLVYMIILWVLMYNSDALRFGRVKLSDTVVAQWIAVLLTNVITYGQLCLIGNGVLPVMPMILFTLIEFVGVFLLCYIFNFIYHHSFHGKEMLLIYGGDGGQVFAHKVNDEAIGYSIANRINVSVGMDKVYQAVDKADCVIINDVTAENRNDILKYAYNLKKPVYLVPKISDIVIRGAEDVNLFDTPLILAKSSGLTFTERFCKRALDLVLVIIAMIPALPIMGIVALCIKLDDGGPVFFKQERATIGGRNFYIYKFRSMIVDAEKAGKAQLASENDPRITKVGRFIRATRLDEIPQLINILKGDMSIVGPRPERPEYIEEFLKEMPEFAYRLNVKGGLTGYAQVYGKYNTKTYDKLRLDLMYIENYSFSLDLKLILMTIQIMFRKESTEGVSENDERNK